MEEEQEGLWESTVWAEKEATDARQKMVDANSMLRKMTEVFSHPADTLTRAMLWNAKLATETPVSGSKLVCILVDFETRIEEMLKEFSQLVKNLDPLTGIDPEFFNDLTVGTVGGIAPQPHPTPQSKAGGEAGTSRRDSLALGVPIHMRTDTQASP